MKNACLISQRYLENKNKNFELKRVKINESDDEYKK